MKIERLVTPVIYTVFTSLLRFHAAAGNRHSSIALCMKSSPQNQQQARFNVPFSSLRSVLAAYYHRTINEAFFDRNGVGRLIHILPSSHAIFPIPFGVQGNAVLYKDNKPLLYPGWDTLR